MAADEDPAVTLRREADDLLARFRAPREAPVSEGRALIKRLRGAREFSALVRVAEAVGREAPKDATTRRLYAQGLIETGHATAAIDVLRPLLRDGKESAEAYGLTGRANKQVFFDAGDKSSDAAQTALKQAITAYRVPFEKNPTSYWHGVNLVAVLTAARRLGLRAARDLQPAALATTLLDVMGRIPPDERDLWYHASVAEANLALGNWREVEEHLKAYVTAPEVDAFAIGSTLRQFTEVWNLEADHQRGRPLIAILRAKEMSLPGAAVQLSPDTVRELATVQPALGQLEAVLGDAGPKTYKWMQNGMTRARSVGAVRKTSDGRRHGTGFLIKASTLGLPSDELVVLTNHHVVNPEGAGMALRPSGAEVQFEAVENSDRHAVTEVLWSSPPEFLDVSILRIAKPPDGIAPLEAAAHLPVLGESQRVYVIGYPAGDELAFSFQDNELIDHEGPPAGTPPAAGRVRLHYRAPTAGGSSGSPVFNEDWEVMGLHHLGGKLGVEKLNGKSGTYAANEGLWIQSIVKAAKP
jgi:S1-C subfamily serine protease